MIPGVPRLAGLIAALASAIAAGPAGGQEAWVPPTIECRGEAVLNVEPDFLELVHERVTEAPAVADAMQAAAAFRAGFAEFWDSQEDLAGVTCRIGEPELVNLATCAAENSARVRTEVHITLPLLPLGTGAVRDAALARLLGRIAEAAASWEMPGPPRARGGVNDPEAAEAEALRAALEQAYPHAASVAAALQGEPVSVRHVEVAGVVWEEADQDRPVAPLVCRATVRVIYGFGR
jgi:hypothetical protein